MTYITLAPTRDVLGRPCSDCNTTGTYELRTIEVPVTIQTNTVLVAVEAAVCSQCGCEMLGADSAMLVDEATERLRRGDLSQFTAVGTVYRQQPHGVTSTS